MPAKAGATPGKAARPKYGGIAAIGVNQNRGLKHRNRKSMAVVVIIFYMRIFGIS